ncbi:MAG: hypothetical protein IKJ67_08740 [Bacteroidales bacterium]|nr:hypothetical protein [Bacteroidales bacterium]
MKEFIKRLMLITAVVLAVTSLMALFASQYFTSKCFLIALYFVLSTALVCGYVHKLVQKNPRVFSSMFLLITFGQMFVHIVVLFLFLLINKDMGTYKTVLIYYLSMYLIYTIFGVLSMMRMVKQANKK